MSSLVDSPGHARLPWQVAEAVATADAFGGETGFTAEDEEGAAPEVEADAEDEDE